MSHTGTGQVWATILQCPVHDNSHYCFCIFNWGHAKGKTACAFVILLSLTLYAFVTCISSMYYKHFSGTGL